ncbi:MULTISPECIES: hypothetical protein [unclassified Rhizobium]|uniref:hypothetical protein n=1 Tax=unclassified Rhizobium TaxID=2613769 RepID=UPI00161F4B74|nr:MULTISPECIES: hypothetical protein [unclassified Rhizobium]MBB3289902.1 hypothetical protein [Rhizobium sp. BK252]MBB3404131.1 hypothetical protein [Rhizobium sp. BK289]MBB3417230.1 hypothetical protein [Rhizobium sp. BK284]MBB3485107.1 hypothetical protein [Rhizobium sp. BK347]
MRDIVHNIAARQAIAPAVQTAAADGVSIDTLGFNSLAFVFTTGAIAGAGDFGVKLMDSDDNATFTDVDDGELQGDIPSTLAAATTYKLGYLGFRRYVRPSVTKAGGTSIALAALAVLGDASIRPVA